MREASGRNPPKEDTWDTFYLQSKLALLALTYPRLRIIWSSSPHESVKILSDLKLNHDEPDEGVSILKGASSAEDRLGIEKEMIENAGAKEMLHCIPGVYGGNLRHVMSKVESIEELVGMKRAGLLEVLGEENGKKAWQFIHHDSRIRRR
jgi:DNA excision repair protein ERCC-4